MSIGNLERPGLARTFRTPLGATVIGVAIVFFWLPFNVNEGATCWM
jgi:hypothetical protein